VAPLASHKDTVESEDVLAEASSLLWRENRMSMHLRSLASDESSVDFGRSQSCTPSCLEAAAISLPSGESATAA
jgi:hypothetical protein